MVIESLESHFCIVCKDFMTMNLPKWHNASRSSFQFILLFLVLLGRGRVVQHEGKCHVEAKDWCPVNSGSWKKNTMRRDYTKHITWWRHQMETFPRYCPLVRRIHVTQLEGSFYNCGNFPVPGMQLVGTVPEVVMSHQIWINFIRKIHISLIST